jgi:hypothetical protein
MTVNEIVILLENKIYKLNVLRNLFFNNGDIENLIKIDKEILETQDALDRIKNC